MLLCTALRLQHATKAFGTAIAACVMLVLILALEQLFNDWISTGGGRLSLRALLLLVAATAVFLVMMTLSKEFALLLACVSLATLIVIACSDERPVT
jgi:hypothetical protein